MTAPSGNVVAVGLQHIRIYELDSHGVPKATAASAVVYEGIQIIGAQGYEITTPDARRIPIKGDNALLATMVLPRQEASSAKLTFASDNHAAYAVMTSTKRAVIGEASVIGYATSEQGSEPTIAVLGYQAAQDLTTNSGMWRSVMVPSTKAIINTPGMTEADMKYEASLIPSSAAHHLWGLAFTDAVEGFLRAEVIETVTDNIPHVVSWLADNTVTEFSFHADRQAVSTAKIHAVITVAVAGTVTDVTGTCTKATDSVTIAGPLAAGVMVCCFYEYAA